MKDIFIQKWSLPDTKERREWFLPVDWLFKALRLERDADYIIYQLVNTLFISSGFLIFLILVDAYLEFNLLINQEEFSRTKLDITSAHSGVISPLFLILTLIFYLRARISINICKEDIPTAIHRALLLSGDQRRWVGRSFFLFIISIFCLSLSHLPIIQLASHYGLENSLSFVLLMMVPFSMLAPAAGGGALIISFLQFEKSLRCFSSLQENLQNNHAFLEKKESRP